MILTNNDSGSFNTTTGGWTLVGGSNNAGAITGPTLDLTGINGALGTIPFNIYTGGTLEIDNSTNNRTSRITTASATPVILNGGTLWYNGNGTTGSVDTIGQISLASGQSTIQMQTNGAATNSLTVSVYARAAGSTVIFQGVNNDIGSATNTLVLASASDLGQHSAGSRVRPGH